MTFSYRSWSAYMNSPEQTNEQCSRHRRARHPSSDQLSRTPAGARSWAKGLQAQSGQVLTRRRPPVNESAAANPLTLISQGHGITALDAIRTAIQGNPGYPHSQPPELNHQLTDTREWTHQVGCVLFAPVDAIERRRFPAFHVPGQLGTTDLARLGSMRSRTLSQAWTASP